MTLTKCTTCGGFSYNPAHCIPARDHDKPQIVCDGLTFRAINKADGFRGPLVSAAVLAGMQIQRRYGKAAHVEAFEDFIRARNAVAA